MSRVKPNFYKNLINVCFFGIIFLIVSILTAQSQVPPLNSCSVDCPFISHAICGTCPDGSTRCPFNYVVSDRSSCTNSCVNYCSERTLTGATCPDGSPLNILVHTDYSTVSGSCELGEACCCSRTSAGACSGVGDPPPSGEWNSCDLISPSAIYKGVEYTCTGIGTGDLTVEIGQAFDLNYTYLGTGPSFPLEARTIMRGPQGVPPTETLDCVYNEDAIAGVWHPVFKPGFTCPAVIIRCKASDNPSSAICGYFDDSFGCRVKCVAPPASLGYLKVFHQALGTIKLNLISVANALSKSPFPGMVKVARFNGDIGTAADLVATSDPMASPVRVYTGLIGTGSPTGIWAWKKLP